MAVIDTINSIKTNLTNAYNKISDKGSTFQGDKNIENLSSAIDNIPSGGGDTYKLFNGSFDVEGLTAIGWDSDDIKFYNDTCVDWNSESDFLYKLTDSELAGDDSSTTRFLPKNTTKTNFGSYSKLLGIPKIDTNNVTKLRTMFYNCTSLETIPQLDTSNVEDMDSMFYGCTSLKTISQLDTSNVTSMYCMFSRCTSLTSIPQLNTSNVKDMYQMFYNCISLTSMPPLDTSSVTRIERMFYGCTNLTSISQLNTSEVTSMSLMFYNCISLTSIPQLDTSKITSMYYTFTNNNALTTIPLLNANKVNDLTSTFSGCYKLTTFGGLKDLGKGYKSKSENLNAYTLALDTSSKLTHDSLMNVINNLYDLNLTIIAGYTQKLELGSTNLAKLTSDEIAIATNKGWTVT